MAARPVIALLTDFGTRDHYVGTMKGVLAGICPDALTIDITHEIPAQDVRSAAWRLAAVWRFFPRDTIFLAVVDPGVGTGRDPVVVRVDGAWLVGPDNGLFDLVLAESPALEAYRLERAEWALPAVSATFEGRDRFAPAAGWLAQGTPAAAFGRALVVAPRLAWPRSAEESGVIRGEVVHVDRFGNLTTNVRRTDWGTLSAADVRIAGHAAALPVVRTYGEAPAGTLVALFGSSGCLEIAKVDGSAADALGVGRGAEVRVSRSA